MTTPPNTWDSLSYHLPRAAEWYQQGGVQFLEHVHTERMNAFQPGAEMQVLTCSRWRGTTCWPSCRSG